MATYQLPGYTELEVKEVKVARHLVPVIVRFRVPDEVKEAMPIDVLHELQCDLLVNFYLLPQIGEMMVYGDSKWLIGEVLHFPSRRHSKQPRRIPLVKALWAGLYVDTDAIGYSADLPEV